MSTQSLPPFHLSPFPKRDSLAGITRADVDTEIADALGLPEAKSPVKPREPSDDWPEPESLGSELPDVPVFDPGLLPDALRPLVEDVARRMQVPLDFPAVAAVATLAGVTNRRALIQPKRLDTSWIVVPNLWGAIIGPPGIMKSPLINCIAKPAREIEAEWRTEYVTATEEFKDAHERAELDRSVWRENYKQAAKKGKPLPEKPESEMEAPAARRLITSDANFESLHQMLSENPAGLCVLRDELTGLLAGFERQGREQERSFYLECWPGDLTVTLDRIGRGRVHVPHACISLFGGFQPARLRSYLADALRGGPSDDGLIQRFQLMVWPDISNKWVDVDEPPDGAAVERVATVLRRIVAMNCEHPPLFRYANDAQKMFTAWRTHLERRVRSDELEPVMQAHLAKYRSLMPSLALLFSLADGDTESVSLRHAQQAADWCEYLEAHARRVYASQMRPEQRAAISLSKRLAKGWRRNEGFFTLRDLYRHCWSGLATPDETRPAIKVLEDYGWIRKVSEAPAVGRPSETYAISPRIEAAHAAH